MWINAGDIILIGLRDYQDTKADVILKYNSDEARNLKAYGELPENGKIILVIIYVCTIYLICSSFGVFVGTPYSSAKFDCNSMISLWLVSHMD